MSKIPKQKPRHHHKRAMSREERRQLLPRAKLVASYFSSWQIKFWKRRLWQKVSEVNNGLHTS